MTEQALQMFRRKNVTVSALVAAMVANSVAASLFSFLEALRGNSWVSEASHRLGDSDFRDMMLDNFGDEKVVNGILENIVEDCTDTLQEFAVSV